ncbi:MAG TPA: putative Ig domain-containing protein [Vicinamibacterales bacterium]|nr:putative Ig domain-containing protein [Vicinamibacterales bacterium]
MQTHIRSSNVIVVLTSFLLTLVAPRLAAADILTLMWDANPAPEVAGYIAHVGTQSGTYTQHFDVGQGTAFTFSSAVAGQRYCFAVSAYIAGPTEGPNSAEVCGYSNTRPVLVNPGARQSTLGQASSLQLSGSDPDGQAVTYGATGLPSGLSLMPSTGFISGTPTSAGSYTVTATVSDGVLNASQAFTWTIVAPDTTVPSVAIASPTSAATYTATSATLTLSGSAADNVGVTQVTWSNNRGGGGTASSATSWSATGIVLQSGSNVLTVIAQDAAGNTSSDALTVTYNLAPTLASVVNQTTTVGQTVALQLAGSDPNGGDLLTYSGTGLPGGLSVSVATGLISGAPTAAGSYAVTVTVSDGSLSASRAFTWTIVGAADTTAPTVTITAPTSAATYVASSATVTLSGTSSDNVGVTQVSWVSNRGGSGMATGTTSWSAGAIALQSGSNILTVTSRDAAGNARSDVLTVTYVAPLQVSLVANRTAPQPRGTTVTFTASATGGTAPYQYKWRLYNGSSWVTVKEWSTSATYRWTPTSARSNYQIVVWARSATNTANTYEARTSMTFPIQ